MGDQEQPKRFAERLNMALDKKGISARELGSLAKISETSISKYRKGIGIPARGKIISLAKVLGVSPMWLLGFSEDETCDLSPEEKARNKVDGLMEGMNLDQLNDTIEFITRYILK